MVEQLADFLAESQDKLHDCVLPFTPPDSRLAHWKSRLKNNAAVESGRLWKENLLEEVLAQSNRLHDPRYAGHQVAVPLPQLAWLQAATALLNNGMAIDEMGPASSPMEEAVMQEAIRGRMVPCDHVRSWSASKRTTAWTGRFAAWAGARRAP